MMYAALLIARYKIVQTRSINNQLRNTISGSCTF